MNEEIRKNKLTDEQIEQVPGGLAVPPHSARAVPPRSGEPDSKETKIISHLSDFVSATGKR